MPRRTFTEKDEEAEINLSSMIDCIFILLIFFVVTTAFVDEKGLSVNKPDAAATSRFSEQENVVVEINQQDQVIFAGKEVRLDEIPERVKQSLTEVDTPVVIRAHEKSSHRMFVNVWDAARRGGAKTLSFSTVN